MGMRRAVFSGSWYPSSAKACEKEIAAFIKEDKLKSSGKEVFFGGIVPHAGWYFSGSLACRVIRALHEDQDVDVMLLFGMHLGPSSPAYMMAEGSWETPFGQLDVDEAITLALVDKYAFQVETWNKFTQDNTIELQLPFVKYFHPKSKIVAIGIPPLPEALEIGKHAVRLALEQGKRVKVIGSTDLTHYGSNYGFSPKGRGPEALAWVRDQNDRNIIDAMLDLDPQATLRQAQQNQSACCSGAAAAAITAAKEMGATTAVEVDYQNSYEKSPGDSFVGYTGILFQ